LTTALSRPSNVPDSRLSCPPACSAVLPQRGSSGTAPEWRWGASPQRPAAAPPYEDAMLGLIFLQLRKFAQQQGGPQAWDALLREAQLPLKPSPAVRVYPDEEVLALVAAASRLLNQPPTAVLEAFGEFLAPELTRVYSRLFQPGWK